MCGIAGIVQFEKCLDSHQLKSCLEKMSATIAHRGPDASGLWIDNDARIGLAHQRLSIIDLSDQAVQPMWSHDQAFCISFNGEIYNYLELRSELLGAGHVFRTQSDTEVLIEAYRRYGADMLSRLDGMFAFALYDVRKDMLFVARDPFGEKPFYYTHTDRYFGFASELKALLHLPSFDDVVPYEEVSKYLSAQYFDGESTIYRGARKLLPGHYATLARGKPLQTKRYFEFRPGENTRHASLDELADELEDILVRSLKRRLRADVPVGAFLSAGVDSSTVVALAIKKLGIPIKAFSAGFKGFSGSEHVEAEEIAKHLGAEHRVYLVSPDDLVLGDHLGDLIDEPNGDTSLLPTYLLCQFARKEVKVALSGDGADELFGGYGRYSQTLSEETLAGQTSSAGRRYYSNRILVFNDSEVSCLIGRHQEHHHDFIRSLQNEVDASGIDVFSSLRKTDVNHYMPGAVLAKVDRMSMRHGLEVRTPFLNLEVARFAEKLPTSVLMHEGVGKYLLKHLASRYLPREWMMKPKRGFGIPSYQWAGKALATLAKTRLITNRNRRTFWASRTGVESWFESIEEGGDNCDYKLWSLLHLDKYLQNSAGKPPAEVDALMICSLRLALAKEHADVIGLATRIFPRWRSFLPNVKYVVSEWADDTEDTITADWSANAATVLEMVSRIYSIEKISVILLDRGGLDKKLRLELQSQNVEAVYYYQNAKWVRESFDTQKNSRERQRTPMVFSKAEELPHRFQKSLVRDDFIRQLPFIGRRLFPEVSSEWLFRQNTGLIRRDTLSRSVQLVSELHSWYSMSSREKKVLRRIATWAKESSQKTNASDWKSQRIALIISDFSSGGAERQLSNLAVGLAASGKKVKVITLHGLQGGGAHYLSLLRGKNVEVVSGTQSCDGFDESNIPVDNLTLPIELIGELPAFMRKYVWHAFSHLVSWKADTLICYLDQPNLMGGLAGLLARIPKIYISFRNHHPQNFEFYHRWYKPYYRALASSGAVQMTGNSQSGNNSYADWIGVERHRVELVRNGVDFSTIHVPGDEEVRALRSEHDASNIPLVVGVFRLASEKQPMLFLDVVHGVQKVIGSLKVLVLGEGPERKSLEAEIQQRGLGDTVKLLGRKTEVSTYLGAADVVLQTAWLEGTPNSLLEAQYLKRAIVTTAAGGAAEAVQHNYSGLVFDTSEPGPLINAVLTVLQDAELARTLGENAYKSVKERFGVDNLVASYLKLFRQDSKEEETV
ncbi:MAG: asparagine synthase (glutamine-hydrolyzing) [Gammaproteobacteria bacterium]|nr:asparagine synthase (glutamine-hydrolyzing) [Gammaproteobacteria bacterium]